MATMTFQAPATVDEAVRLLAASPGARVLSGGTDLVVQMRSGRLAPDEVIDLKRIPELGGVAEADDGFTIGAAVPCMALADHAGLAAAWPGVIEAAGLIGSVQVRNRATLAGNLCNASPAADSVPALIAAGAVAIVAGPGGRREVPVAQVPAAPGRTTLGEDEIVVALRLPPRGLRAADAYQRLTPRSEMDIAIVGLAAWVALDDSGACVAARIALGAAGPVARAVQDAAAALVGSRFDTAAMDAMAAAVSAACDPIDDKRATAAYRRAMAAVIARRVVAVARERAEAAA